MGQRNILSIIHIKFKDKKELNIFFWAKKKLKITIQTQLKSNNLCQQVKLMVKPKIT